MKNIRYICVLVFLFLGSCLDHKNDNRCQRTDVHMDGLKEHLKKESLKEILFNNRVLANNLVIKNSFIFYLGIDETTRGLMFYRCKLNGENKVSIQMPAEMEFLTFDIVDSNSVLLLKVTTGDLYHLNIDNQKITLKSRFVFGDKLSIFKNYAIIKSIKGIYVYNISNGTRSVIKNKSLPDLNSGIEYCVNGSWLYISGILDAIHNDAQVRCYNLKDCENPVWTTHIENKNTSQILFGDSSLYVFASQLNERSFKIYKLSPTTGEVINLLNLDEVVNNVIMTNDSKKIIFSDFQKLYCIDAVSLIFLWKKSLLQISHILQLKDGVYVICENDSKSNKSIVTVVQPDDGKTIFNFNTDMIPEKIGDCILYENVLYR